MVETTSGLRAALAEASAPEWSVRVRAARGLASFADVPEAGAALVGLLLDAADTAVTRRAAEALARVGTVAAVRILALAVAEADDSQADWMQTGVQDVMAEPDGAPGLAAVCGQLARDPQAAVRRGAAEISAWTDVTGC
ncbi:HEAT repeat domain-containing protein [Streptomyces bobili]|uniref:HEAT repeat domain-containing protein n=1 Tax=Streptomyces bobili TaxID=67280 RepID=UPI0033FC6360